MTEAEFSNIPSAVLCRHCLERKGNHGGANNPHRAFACPAPEQFPRWPEGLPSRDANREYDRRLKAFWTVRTTAFEPLR